MSTIDATLEALEETRQELLLVDPKANEKKMLDEAYKAVRDAMNKLNDLSKIIK